jgi:hypothetical protein
MKRFPVLSGRAKSSNPRLRWLSRCLDDTCIADYPPVGLPVSNRLSRQHRFSMIQRFATTAAAIMLIATAAAIARYKFVTSSLPSRCVAFRIRCLAGAIIWTK